MDYKNSGVDIEAGYKSVELMKEYVKGTMRPEVLGGLGGFSGAFSLKAIKDMEDPVLLSGTDGCGTKVKLAIIMDKHDTIGIDAVAMCVNDVACAGGEPLFFLDYIACGKNYPEKIAMIVKGVAEGCKMSECALIGGETAEHPGLMPEEDYDLAGFSVGVIDRKDMITGQDIKDGDTLVAIASSGVHSNGFSLVRKLYTDLNEEFNGEEVWKTLITPTKLYVKPVLSLIEKFNIKGMSHITGGGFIENVPRMFNGAELTAEIRKDSYPLPAIFEDMISRGVARDHMYNTFNMGIGFVLCVNEADVQVILNELEAMGEKAYEIGVVTAGGEGVCLK